MSKLEQLDQMLQILEVQKKSIRTLLSQTDKDLGNAVADCFSAMVNILKHLASEQTAKRIKKKEG